MTYQTMKTQMHKRALPVVLVAAFALLAAPAAFGADALLICESGVPYQWPNAGANIPFNPDRGPLGPLTNPQAVALTQQAFDVWGAVATATTSYTNAGLLPVDVDITNFGPFLNPVAPDGLSAIVFDDTGEIFDLLFGPGSGILGFAGPEWIDPTNCEVIEGVSFLNGPSFGDLTAALDVMVHEFGHYSNLGHVELNGQLVVFSEGGDDSGPSPSNPWPIPPFSGTELVETMYPLYFGPPAGTRTLHADDISSLSKIYPSAALASRGAIRGSVLASNGDRLSGVNVIARNIADPFNDSVSTFSGAYTDSTSQADPVTGTFELGDLTPGATYALFIDEVTAAGGRFSNFILQPLPGPEEFWNGANESDDEAIDDPLEFVGIVTAAGTPVENIDIVFNAPGPGQIPLGDDDFAELFLPFNYEICGQSFASVFVNSNGSLTFGAGDTDFSESVGEFLGEAPRIAPLWDDLNPSQGGTVSFSFTSNTFSVRYENVPEFFSTGANTFEVTLHRASNHIDIEYGDVSAADGIAGVSCGVLVTSGSEAESDLSAFGNSTINLHGQPAIYEQFTFGEGVDLANSTVEFNGTTNYEDNWAEPNDSLSAARNINLPFNSSDVVRFTEIEPTGGDIDFFAFTAEAGQTLVAEVTAGGIDSLIALFDDAGNLVAVDDDGGSGLLSQIVFPISATGSYTLAVTTFPDVGFVGAGGSGGRYVLDIATIDGFLLSLPDDGSQEVGLGFSFPFQGVSYTSVFVNSNGNLTFGSGDTDFSESVSELLSDQPRIAALWDDLSPNNGGQVTAEFGDGTFTVNFDEVPEFFSTGANTFSVTLRADGSVTIAYGAVSATDGLVGVTEGGGAVDPGETDLSAGGSFPVLGTTYEQFTFGDPFDLSGTVIDFVP